MKQFGKPVVEFKGEIHFSHPARQLWKYISNLDIMDRMIGAPKPTYTMRASADRKIRPWGTASMMGIIFEYEELPFEWVPLSHFSLERIHHVQYSYQAQ